MKNNQFKEYKKTTNSIIKTTNSKKIKKTQFRGRIGTTGIQSPLRSRAQAEMGCRLKTVPTGVKKPVERVLPKARASLKPRSVSRALPPQTTRSLARAASSTQQRKGAKAKEGDRGVEVVNNHLGTQSAKVVSLHHPPMDCPLSVVIIKKMVGDQDLHIHMIITDKDTLEHWI